MNPTELTALDRQTYGRRLREMAERLAGGVSQLEAEAERDPEEEVAREALASEEVLLAEANAALARLADGTFGKCGRCGRPISKGRLEAIPYARECIRCARQAGQPGREQ